ncbi:MAG: SPFH domain-containing protein [bacterium]|nr:SPFH domain-containing protein [bacterium]
MSIFENSGSTVTLVIGLLLAFGFIFFSVSSILRFIRKVPSNEALLVFGVGCKSKIKTLRRVVKEDGTFDIQEEFVTVNYRLVKGGMTLVFPVMQVTKSLDLRVKPQDIKVENVLTNNAVPVSVDGVAQLAIGDDDASLVTAARLHLDKNPDEILTSAKETLQGHLRSIIGQMTVESLFKDREAFARKVNEVASDDMAGLGLRIVSFVIRELSDPNHYLDALGKPEIAAALAQARIAQARQDQEATLKEQEAERNKASYVKDTNVAKATYDAEVAKNQAVAERSKDISMAVQDMTLEQKKAAAAEIAAQRRNMELDTEVRRPADAKKYETEVTAAANLTKVQKEADAKLYQAQQDATATIATAEAEKTQGLYKADVSKAGFIAEAAGSEAKLLAEAAGIEAKLMAEAKGKRELANALNSYSDSALRQVLGTQLLGGIPDVARAFASSFEKVGEIRLIDMNGNSKDGDDVVQRFMNYLPENLFKFLQGATALLGTPIDDIAVGMITNIAKKRGIEITDKQAEELKQKIEEKRIAEAGPVNAETHNGDHIIKMIMDEAAKRGFPITEDQAKKVKESLASELAKQALTPAEEAAPAIAAPEKRRPGSKKNQPAQGETSGQ